jgi:hypothetical protein
MQMKRRRSKECTVVHAAGQISPDWVDRTEVWQKLECEPCRLLERYDLMPADRQI